MIKKFQIPSKKFRILHKIGQGTYSKVYKGVLANGDLCAIKKFHASISQGSDDEGISSPTICDASVHTRLNNHPNIVTLIDFLIYKNNLFSIMEYMESNLGAYITRLSALKQTTMHPEVIKKFLLQILCGIYYCHSNGIMHRDMKPENLLIDANRNLKVADFSLAHIYVPKYNNSLSVITLPYRPPEIILENRRYDYKVDIWSIGCIFAEMSLLCRLFEGKSTVMNLLDEIFQLRGTPSLNEFHRMSGRPLIHSDTEKVPKYLQYENVPHWKKTNQLCDAVPLLKDQNGLALLEQMLELDYHKRVSAFDALKHPYFLQ